MQVHSRAEVLGVMARRSGVCVVLTMKELPVMFSVKSAEHGNTLSVSTMGIAVIRDIPAYAACSNRFAKPVYMCMTNTAHSLSHDHVVLLLLLFLTLCFLNGWKRLISTQTRPLFLSWSTKVLL